MAKSGETSPPPHSLPLPLLSTPTTLSFPRAHLSLSLFLRYFLTLALFLSWQETARAGSKPRVQSREEDEDRRMKGEDRVEESRPDVYRGAYISRERKRGSGDPLVLSFSLSHSFSLFLPIFSSRHRPVIPPRILPSLPLSSCSSLLLLSLHGVMLRYEQSCSNIRLIGLAGSESIARGYREGWLVRNKIFPRIV